LSAKGAVGLLIFAIGEERFGADASQVIRIEPAGAIAIRQSVLGRASKGGQALVFDGGAACAERSLAIDEVLELRQVPISQLRRKSFVLESADAAVGFWLDGERPVVLVDLRRATS
jgi:chemotaxis signal transduction protein